MGFMLSLILAGCVVVRTSILPGQKQGEKIVDETPGRQGSAADQEENEGQFRSGAEKGQDDAAEERAEPDELHG